MNRLARRAATAALSTVCDVAGRRWAVRAARFTLNSARLDGPNDPARNGEHLLQRWVLAALSATSEVTVFDVGANVGEWSQALLREASRTRSAGSLHLHAFEPASFTYQLLSRRLRGHAQLQQLALSSTEGEAALHVAGPGAGTNSLHETGGVCLPTEVVHTTSIDKYVHAHGIGRIDLLKVDTEGHDLEVLKGAHQSLRAGLISVAQFEYNHRWIYARNYLRDVFDLVGPLGYLVGKLTPRGMESYPSWDPDLETFIEGNYLVATRAMARCLPQIRWWKQPCGTASKIPLSRKWDAPCTSA